MLRSAAPSLVMDHIALPAFEVEATFRFYTRILGLPLVDAFSGDDSGGRAWLMMLFELGDGRQLALCALQGMKVPAASAIPDDTCHYAFAVDSTVQLSAWKQRLATHEVAFREEDHGTQQSLYFSDPNATCSRSRLLRVIRPLRATPQPWTLSSGGFDRDRAPGW